jgi:simple sugar transport system permease protein
MRSAKQQEIMVALGLPAGALVISLLLFGVFVAGSGANPFTAYTLMYMGGFGTWFSWQNTLQRAAPLILTALCTAIPAHLGLVIIGGEGALVLGGLGAVVMALHLPGSTPWLVQLAMALAGMMAGGLLILLAGALRQYCGVLRRLVVCSSPIAIAVFNHLVEGPMRDPASLNKPSTAALDEAHMLGMLPGMEVHWGLVYGLLACVVVYVLMSRTVFGFAARMVGGNARAAQLSGLPIGRPIPASGTSLNTPASSSPLRFWCSGASLLCAQARSGEPLPPDLFSTTICWPSARDS